MRRHKVSFPEAIEALMQERRRMWEVAMVAVSERHGLDDSDATLHCLTHAIDGSETIQ